MIWNDLDLGGSHPWAMPKAALQVVDTVVPGTGSFTFSLGATKRQQRVGFYIRAWQAIGGSAAYTLKAAQYLLRQAEELAANHGLQPVYVRWTQTADSTAPLAASDLHDGWYLIEDFQPDYRNYVVAGTIACQATFTWISSAPPQRTAVWYAGGALSSNYSVGGTNLLAAPLNAVGFGGGTRTGSEGAVPYGLSLINPYPLTLSATIGDWWKCGVRAWDTINTGSNPVPTAGLAVNANWVEIKGVDHDLQGDLVVTNGLQLLLFQTGQPEICVAYLWNTALGTAAWQNYTDPQYLDNAGNSGTLRQYTLTKLSLEEVSVECTSESSGGNLASLRLRLQRGSYIVRVDFTPLSQANTVSSALALDNVFSNPIVFCSNGVADGGLAAEQLLTVTPPTDYGYSGILTRSSTYPLICGWLWQNQPASQLYTGANVTYAGDSSGPAQTARRSYGFYAIPFASITSYQQEMESATLAAGFVSVTDTGASGGSVAKLPSGTASGATATAAGFTVTTGNYDCWYRVRVTSAASATVTLRLGLYDATSGWVAGQYTDYAPNSFVTAYGTEAAWVKVAANFAPSVAHQAQFRAQGVNGNAPTDFWVDEAVLAPTTLSGGNIGPREIFQQFLFDRTTSWARY